MDNLMSGLQAGTNNERSLARNLLPDFHGSSGRSFAAAFNDARYFVVLAASACTTLPAQTNYII